MIWTQPGSGPFRILRHGPVRAACCGAIVLAGIVHLHSNWLQSRREILATYSSRLETAARDLDSTLHGMVGLLTAGQLAAQDHLRLVESGIARGSPRLADWFEPATNFDGYQLRRPPVGPPTDDYGQLTGLGILDPLDAELLAEIDLSFALRSHLRNADRLLPDAAWVYYVSHRKLMYIVPWSDPAEFHVGPEVYQLEFWTGALPENNPQRQRYWTAPYEDSYGQGMMVTYSAPIDHAGKFHGSLSMDITLRGLSEILTRSLAAEDHALLISDAGAPIAAHATESLAGTDLPAMLRSAVTPAAGGATATNGFVGEHGLLVRPRTLAEAPWHLGMFVARETLCWEVFDSLLPQLGLALLLAVLLVFAEVLLRGTHKLDAARQEAERAMRARSTFLATMSHEIRTPMNGMMGLVDLMLDDPALPATEREQLTLMRQAADHLLHIVNDILDFSKIEAGHLDLEQTSFSLRAVLEQVLKTHRARAIEQLVELDLDWPADAPDCFTGDPVRISQVISNLVGNAIKFSPNGKVTVEVACGAASMGERRALRFSVIDTGIGIPTDRLSDIFEPFRQADSSTTRRFGGTGLGLAICQHIVLAMHGTLRVSSTLGQGSRFDVDLTLLESPCPAPPTHALPVREPNSTLRILVAEDNHINQIVIDRLLRSKGHQVTIAADGEQTVAAWAAGEFDLVLMDVHMPVMDGLEATRRIRAAEAGRPATPIHALSASVLEEDRLACAAAGMNGFLTKPVSKAELDQLLRSIAEHANRADAAGVA